MNEVYLITNRVNGKRYVGITCRGYVNRFKEHIHDALANSDASDKTRILHNAIRKYGPENFDVIVLEDNISDNQAEEKEKYYIDLYNTFYTSNIGYNMTRGGGGVVAYRHTPESRKKISEKLKGHKFSESRNKKIKDAMTGREYKQEWKDALSKSRKGRFAKEYNPFYGKHHSDATKEIVSKSNSKHAVYCIDVDTFQILHVFRNQCEAGRWVVDSGFATCKPLTCAGRIGEVCRNGSSKCIAYGFHWRFEEGQSTNCNEEDELPHEAQTTV